MLKEKTTAWSTDTRRGERPEREVQWAAALYNGDVQVLYEEDTRPNVSAGCHRNYYISMWDEGAFVPMFQCEHDLDTRRFIEGFARIEEEPGNIDDLCGLFRREDMDRRPLFLRGYALAFTSFERGELLRLGQTTREHHRGYRAGVDDCWMKDGYVNTDYKGGSCHEPVERVKWLL